MGKTKIAWTDKSWNPATGCVKVSPGCDHCYAQRFAERWRDIPGHAYEHGFDIQIRPKRLTQPYRWMKPCRVFVCSMSDLFQPAIPFDYIAQVFDVMTSNPRHTFQVLTKRPVRMLNFITDHKPPLGNVWLGTTVENSTMALMRVPALQQIQAPVRFLSAEPLLGPLKLDLDGIHQVIVGGESGPWFRPMDPAWAMDIRDQCRAAGVAFFFKQHSGVRPRTLGRELDGVVYEEYPEVAG
jgi:protein gp37